MVRRESKIQLEYIQINLTDRPEELSFTLDFGSHRIGYFSFHCGIQGVNADAPARLKLTFGEIPFDVLEDLHPCKTWISTSWVPDETINVDWCPTDVDMARRYSFRYVRVQVLDTSPKFKVTFENIRVRAVSAIEPSTKVPSFRLQDALLNRIDAVSISHCATVCRPFSRMALGGIAVFGSEIYDFKPLRITVHTGTSLL